MNLVTKLTRDCLRQDCQISLGGQSTTLLGFTQSYDKSSNPTHRDPNTHTSRYSCATCGKRWKIESRDGEDDKISTDDLRQSTR